MIIGVPKEIKNNEYRVGLTPAGVSALVKAGHQLFVQATAGNGSGINDDEYVKAGATILPTIEDVYGKAEMIIKVKEPIASEYPLIKENQLLFTYFHFASYEPLTTAMINSKSVCLAYETVEKPDRSLPLLIPMSEVAGRMSIQEGAKYLEKPMGGRGVLLGGVPGVRPASVLILGQGGKGGLGYSPVIKSGGGGGASGILRQFNMSLSPSTYPVSFGPYPGGTVSFNGQSATGGTNGTNGIHNNGGGGGSNADYSGYDGGDRNGGAGAGAGGNATGSLYKYGPGIHSSISGSDIEYGVGGEGGLGASGSNGQNGPSGIVIIRYKYK